MEETFEKLIKEGKNSVDNLIKWMRDSNILDNTKESERKARELFNKSVDKANVNLGQFIEVVAEMADKQQNDLEDLVQKLGNQAKSFEKDLEVLASKELQALHAGASAFASAYRDAKKK